MSPAIRAVAHRALASLLLLLAGRALAEREVPLRVEPGATCLSRDALSSWLKQALAGAQVADGIEAEVTGSSHDPRSVALRIRYPDDSEFVRTFSPAPERCEHLHQTVALALALALKASPPAEADADGEAARSPRANTRLHYALGAGALVTPGLLGGFSGGAQLHAALMARALGVRVGVLGARSTEQAMPGSGRYTLGLVAARLDLCARLGRHDRFSAELCVGPLAGMYLVRGSDLSRSRDARLRFMGVSAGVDVVRALGRAFALRGSAAVLASLQPATVVARDRNEKIVDRQDVSRVGGALLLGIDYRFE